MSNMELIQELINDHKEKPIEIEFEGKTYNFNMRPLTDGEINQLKNIENKKLNTSLKMGDKRKQSETTSKINNADFLKSQQKTIYQAVSWSLSVDGEPKVKPEHVEKLSKGLPDLLFEKVVEISKLTEEDLLVLKRFRKDK